jgi:hypothetical protein
MKIAHYCAKKERTMKSGIPKSTPENSIAVACQFTAANTPYMLRAAEPSSASGKLPGLTPPSPSALRWRRHVGDPGNFM